MNDKQFSTHQPLNNQPTETKKQQDENNRKEQSSETVKTVQTSVLHQARVHQLHDYQDPNGSFSDISIAVCHPEIIWSSAKKTNSI